jgi:DNA-binding transcriptional LysR family regulator
VRLFDRGTRVPTLAPPGTALLPEARALVLQADRLTARARQIAEGTEALVTLAVDVMFPTKILFAALAAFRKAFPTVPLLLRTEALGAVFQVVLDDTCQVGIAQPIGRMPATLEQRPLTSITVVPLAAATHPLARHRGPIPIETLRAHVQLVLTDRSRLSEGYDPGVAGGPCWRLADLGTKHECLRAGFGWGSMPLHVVADDLKKRRLVRLRPAASGPEVVLPISVVFKPERPPGPATRWLLEQLGARCRDERTTVAGLRAVG